MTMSMKRTMLKHENVLHAESDVAGFDIGDDNVLLLAELGFDVAVVLLGGVVQAGACNDLLAFI
jgi:hypothetical protein